MHGRRGAHADGRACGKQCQQGNDENTSALKFLCGRSGSRLRSWCSVIVHYIM
jgi:hypothetical protein